MDYEKLERKVANLSSLIDVSAVINSTLDLDELLQIVLSIAENVLLAEASSILLINEETQVLELKVARGPVGERLMRDGVKLGVGQGIAGTVAQTGKPLLVKDAKADPNFFGKIDAETGFETRSIMTAPLRSRDKLVGVAQLINKKSGAFFDEEDLELFVTFGNQVAIAVENTRMHGKLIRQQRMEQELELASVVQRSFLPDPFPEHPHFGLAGWSASAQNVGGDFYDYIIFDEKHIGVIVGDVSGKGVPAALHMARLVSDFRFQAARLVEPAPTMKALNDLLVKRAHRGSFVTALYAFFDLNRMEVLYCNAGHCPFFVLKDGIVDVAQKVQEPPLGIETHDLFSEEAIALSKDSFLVFFTDGVIEARNRNRESLGIAEFTGIVEGTHVKTPEELILALILDIQSFSAGSKQHDDITLVACQVK